MAEDRFHPVHELRFIRPVLYHQERQEVSDIEEPQLVIPQLVTGQSRMEHLTMLCGHDHQDRLLEIETTFDEAGNCVDQKSLVSIKLDHMPNGTHIRPPSRLGLGRSQGTRGTPSFDGSKLEGGIKSSGPLLGSRDESGYRHCVGGVGTETKTKVSGS